MSALSRPPLKWAGGKFRLLERILQALPERSGSETSRLVEPFVGSGAVFLNTGHRSCLLCDSNRDLINFFQCLADGRQRFIKTCARNFTPATNTADTFYALRDTFNTLPFGERRAALFLYLNRHAYNGLMRYNAKGHFNTPFGRYAAPYFPQAEMEAMLARCESGDIVFAERDFRGTFAGLLPGDVVYCDPPYVTLSDTANFTAYTAGAFGPAEQLELAECARKASAGGVTVVISNHDTPFTREIYAGAALTSFPVQRFISCNGANRAKAQELLAVFHGSDSPGNAGE